MNCKYFQKFIRRYAVQDNLTGIKNLSLYKVKLGFGITKLRDLIIERQFGKTIGIVHHNDNTLTHECANIYILVRPFCLIFNKLSFYG